MWVEDILKTPSELAATFQYSTTSAVRILRTHNATSSRWLHSSVGTAPAPWIRIPIRPEFFSGFNFTTAQVVCITAMINHKFISFSAIQIYDLSYIQFANQCKRRFPRCHLNLAVCHNEPSGETIHMMMYSGYRFFLM